MTWKVALFSFLLAAILAVGFLFIRFLFSERPLTYSEALGMLSPELKPAPARLSPEHNALQLARQAVKEAGGRHSLDPAIRPIVRGKPPTEHDWRILGAEFTKRQKVVGLVERIIEIGAIQYPHFPDGTRESLELFGVARVFECGFRLALHDGKYQEAFRYTQLTVGMAKTVYRGEQGKIFFLTADLPERMGLAELRRLTEAKDVPKEVLEEVLEELPEESGPDSLYARILVCDFHAGFLDDLLHPDRSRKEMDLPGPLDQRKTLRIANQLTTTQVRNTRVPWVAREDIQALRARLTSSQPERPFFLNYGPGVYSPTPADRADEALYKAKSLAVPNAMGLELIKSTLGEAGDELSFRRRAEINIVRTFAAIRLFQFQTGRLPASLKGIAKRGILKSVPIDPYDGQPLRYLPKGSLVYSIGENGVDDHGAIVSTNQRSPAPEGPLDYGFKLEITADNSRFHR